MNPLTSFPHLIDMMRKRLPLHRRSEDMASETYKTMFGPMTKAEVEENLKAAIEMAYKESATDADRHAVKYFKRVLANIRKAKKSCLKTQKGGEMESNEKRSPVTMKFATIAERDAYIDEHFPKRQCTDTPGLYKVPDGYLGVRLEEVTFFEAA